MSVSDGTADSMHAGHLVPVMFMMHLQRAGHRSIGLVGGGGTTMVGDPAAKTEMRQMLSAENIEANACNSLPPSSTIICTLTRAGLFLKITPGGRWTSNIFPFCARLAAILVSIACWPPKPTKLRLERGLSFIEFNYQLLQAYDFLELYRRYGCIMQMGGDDQWSNLLAGVDLIRRVEGATAQAMTYHLLTTADGAKMGKTAAGAVWLDSERLSPYDYYQYWINCDDRDVAKLLKIFTFLPVGEINRLAALEGAELREAKRVLAFEATKITHGEEAARAAQTTASAAFGRRLIVVEDNLALTDSVEVKDSNALADLPTTLIPRTRLEQGLGVLEIFAETGLTQSRGEARRMVQQGGIYVNDQRVDEVEAVLTPDNLTPAGILLRAGKKKYHRLVIEGE